MVYYATLISFALLQVTTAVTHQQSDPELQLSQFIDRLKTSTEEIISRLELPEDTFLNISEYLTKHGYPFESYDVTTEDGFILSLHRIPQSGTGTNHPVVMFIPPLLCSSMDWVSQGRNTSLALLLHQLGYDIWLANPRGTRYSMNHLTLNSSQQEFWNFSFHEKGYYDIPSSIDYILNVTGVAKLTTVSFSEGTTASMVLSSTRPEYNDKLELMVLLSPIGYMGGVNSTVLVFLSQYLTELQLLADLLKLYGVPYTEWLARLLVEVCSIDGFDIICSDVMGLFMGFDSDELDLDYMLVLLSDKPSGVSVKQLMHYGQEIVAASFRQYDYGAIGNLARYGTSEPPNYEVSNITAPLAAYYGKNDYLASTDDVERLLSKIPNVADAYLIEYESFSHLDFLAAKDVKTMLYDRVTETIQKYTKV